MQLNTVIFDMDGLLIDSEPLWNEAATEVFKGYGMKLSEEQYASTVGIRTKEFVQWWFNYFNIGDAELQLAETKIEKLVLEKVFAKGKPMQGIQHIFNFFISRGFKTGIASSSPMELIELVADICGIKKYVQQYASAKELPYGKPHPQVYLNCAALLNSHPLECVCFEDSYTGMIAAKAARMKCVVVPHVSQLKDERWSAADLKLSSLQNFGELHLQLIQ